MNARGRDRGRASDARAPTPEIILPELPVHTYLRWCDLVRRVAVDRGQATDDVLDAIERQAREAARTHRLILRPRLSLGAEAIAAARERIGRSLTGALDDHDPVAEELEEPTLEIMLVLSREEPGGGTSPTTSSSSSVRETGSIRVLIADDDPRVRKVLATTLDADELDVVGIAADAEEAIRLAAAERPDVALLDVRMPGGGGGAAARGIAALSPETTIVAHSALEDRQPILDMLRSGAAGYLLKGMDPQDLASAMRSAVRGEPLIAAELVGHVVDELSQRVRSEARMDGVRENRARQIRRFAAGRGMRMVGQPIYELGSGLPVGIEALARFDSPPHDPEPWFREAWDLGLGPELELAALQRAVAALPSFPEEVYLSVNLSPDTLLSQGFIETKDGLPWERIVLEVTEHVPIADYERFREPVADLRRRGARIAVDDAGAGFASFHHVVELSPDLIKLDRRLTLRIAGDERRRALARALVAFAEEVGTSVVAEGIETGETLRILRRFGVGFGQGHFLATPSSGALRPAALDLALRPAPARIVSDAAPRQRPPTW
ncbi:MAG TPA: EAL domain-containing protein [Actinomycetota bacterium]